MRFLQPFTGHLPIKKWSWTQFASRILLLISITTGFPAHAIDLWLEKQTSEALSRQLPENQIKWLKTGDNLPFLAVYKTTPLPDRLGVVLILPDLGKHPMQSHTIQGLMNLLPENGWNSLTLHSPTPETPASDDEDLRLFEMEKKRVTSAINFLESEGIGNIAIISEGYTADLAAAVFATDSELQDKIAALILIDARHDPGKKNWRNLIDSMKNLPMAVLDIFSTTASSDVTEFATQRIDAARIAARTQQQSAKSDSTAKVRKLAWNKDNNHHFRQIRLHSNNPGFENGEDGLIKNIRGWLQRYVADK